MCFQGMEDRPKPQESQISACQSFPSCYPLKFPVGMMPRSPPSPDTEGEQAAQRVRLSSLRRAGRHKPEETRGGVSSHQNSGREGLFGRCGGRTDPERKECLTSRHEAAHTVNERPAGVYGTGATSTTLRAAVTRSECWQGCGAQCKAPRGSHHPQTSHGDGRTPRNADSLAPLPINHPRLAPAGNQPELALFIVSHPAGALATISAVTSRCQPAFGSGAGERRGAGVRSVRVGLEWVRLKDFVLQTPLDPTEHAAIPGTNKTPKRNNNAVCSSEGLKATRSGH